MLYAQVLTAAPQLKGDNAEIRMRLGQALQNRRKYENDLKSGKRKRKSRWNNEELLLPALYWKKVFLDTEKGLQNPSPEECVLYCWGTFTYFL